MTQHLSIKCTNYTTQHNLWYNKSIIQNTYAMNTIYPCPTCQTPSPWQDNPHRPFCSERCKLIDLGEWASESYKLPTQSTPFSNELNNDQHLLP